MAGLSLFVVLVALIGTALIGTALIGTALVLPRSGEQRAGEGLDHAPAVNAAGAAVTVSELVAAVRSGDSGRAADLAVDNSSPTAEVLAGIARNARLLRVADLGGRYVGEMGSPASDGSWTGVLELAWRFEGFNDQVARARLSVMFVPQDGAVLIAGTGGAPRPGRAVPLWLQGPLEVRRGMGYLVLVDGTARRAAELANDLGAAIRTVRRSLPRWQPRVIVEVPGTASGVDQAAGAAAGTHRGIAATVAGTPPHIIVNPEDFPEAGSGAQAVLAHEIAHLALGSHASEPWVSEGCADFVALRETSAADSGVLALALDAVRSEGVPDALPGEEDFDASGDELQAAYEMSWLAIRLVAEKAGVGATLAVCADVARGVPVEETLAEQGIESRALTRWWRRRLESLAPQER